METEVKTPDFEKMIGDLNEKVLEKAVRRTVSEFKTRGPAQVTKSITAVYGIKSADVTAAGKAAKGNARNAGKTTLHGVTVDKIQLVYSGRLLTPTHFSMTPKKRPTKKKYAVKAAIFKGQKKALGSSTFLAESGSAGTTEIPFKRTTEKRYPIEAVKTVSIPQMITNKTASVDIASRTNELMRTRLEHHIKRLSAKD